MTLDPIAKVLIILGGLLILAGIGWQFGWIQAIRLGRLPGDIFIKNENMHFYFPITSGLLVSAFVSLILWLFRS